MSSNPQNQSKGSGPPPLALFVVMAGGGVVGHDYARGFEIDPVGGAIIGGVISLILINWLYYLYRDPEGKVREFFSFVGFIIGVVVGGGIASADADGEAAWFIGAAVGGVLGIIMGQAVALAVALAAFTLLFISQGPIGLVLRTYILDSYE